ncbi:hypothetical protein EDC30_110110 [Paucimonas lemoignei]|uniref:Uncharacterized protein n=1 Tax=Paucimonas lemoignei TaxID=29443 RepID=A0A4R3HU19_PAULE|nr:hypothetical protein [Paucimonas lemoignei]TCS35641.1 hypothetical protein EDC30_110110 [Paucimonas lemoignei]
MENPDQIVFDRQKLYEEIWAEPVVIVARRYGLSDVGLAKICKKLSIPLPSRGYWAKVKAGRIMKKIPLPDLKENTPTSAAVSKVDSARKAAEAAVKQKIHAEGNGQTQIDVPAELGSPHPLVKAANKRLRQRDGWNDESGLRTAPDEVLNLRVTPSSLDRALLLTDTLLKELEKQSVSVHVDTQRKETVLELAGTRVSFCITEQVKRTHHQDTPAETRAKERYWKQPFRNVADYPHTSRYDYLPTGVLTISAGRWPTRNWNDTGRTPLEKRLMEVLAGIVALIEETGAKEAEAARQREERRLREERYAFLTARRESEGKRFEQLEAQATNWERARRIRRFVAAAEQKSLAEGRATPEQQEWMAWALAKADWLDPLVQVSDPILDAPEPKRPGYY